MKITENHIAYKKKIGHIGEKPVIELATTGGLYMCVTPKGNSFETLGVGSHRAIARHIAKKKEKDLVITELNKTEELDFRELEFLVPKYEEMTREMRKAQGLDG